MTWFSGLPRLAVLFLALGMMLVWGRGFAAADSPAPDGGQPVELFVATNGNDAWSGTLPEPNAEKTDVNEKGTWFNKR